MLFLRNRLHLHAWRAPEARGQLSLGVELSVRKFARLYIFSIVIAIARHHYGFKITWVTPKRHLSSISPSGDEKTPEPQRGA